MWILTQMTQISNCFPICSMKRNKVSLEYHSIFLGYQTVKRSSSIGPFDPSTFKFYKTNKCIQRIFYSFLPKDKHLEILFAFECLTCNYFIFNFGNNKHEINRKVTNLFQLFCNLSVFGVKKTDVMLFSNLAPKSFVDS